MPHPQRFTGGAYLRVLATAMITVLVCGFVAACGGSSSTDTKTLNLLTWDGYHDPAWLDAFTKETGIKVNSVSAGSPDEMFAKVKSNPGQFDIILATAGWFDNYAKADLLEPIDTSKLTAEPNPGFDWQTAASSGGKPYGVLLQLGRPAPGLAARLHPQHPRGRQVPRCSRPPQ